MYRTGPPSTTLMGALPVVMLNTLNEMRGKEELCDIRLSAGGIKFPAHKVVLAALSPFFRTLFSSTFDAAKENEVEIPDTNAETLDTTLKFMYTAQLQEECIDLISVLELAEFLQMGCLKCVCCESLKSKVTQDNCQRLYQVTRTLQLHDLHDATKRFMYHHGLYEGVHKQFCHKIVLIAGGTNWASQSLRSAECLTKLHGNLRWRHSRPPLAEIESSSDTLAVMENHRIGPAFVASSTHLYCIGGVFSETVERYSLALNKWKTLAPLPLKLHGAAAALVDGSIWVIGGSNSQDWENRVWIYNLKSNKWHQGPKLPEKRMFHSAVTWHNTIYVIGGKTEANFDASKTLLMLAPGSMQWLPLTPMIKPRANFGCTLAHGCIYVLGGGNRFGIMADCERYNLVSNKWSSIADYSIPVEGCRGATLVNKTGEETVLCIGGHNGHEVINRVERLGVTLSEWHVVPEINTPRSNFAVGVFPKYT